MKSVIVSALLLVPAVVVVRAAQFVNCDAGQQSIIKSAAEQATSLVLASSQYLGDSQPDTLRISTWFGPYVPPRFMAVRDRFRSLAGNGFNQFTYDCSSSSCQNDKTDPGNVDSHRFGEIQLCSIFWGLPTTGADSQAGALVALSSMFVENGGAKAFVRGQEKCKELAKNNPDDAVQSTCSYQYFAENTPPLP